MEHLNQIELRGIIGSVYVKDFVNAKVANFSVATDYCYTAKDGTKVIDVTWHRVVAWEGKQIQNLSELKKGSPVHVIGRLRMQRYTDANGAERSTYEILAHTVEIIETN